MKFAWIALALLGLTPSLERADDAPGLKSLEARYDQAKLATDEILREKYIMELAMLRFHLSHGESLAWQQVEAEMERHPAPANSDSKTCRKLRAGVWYSPRHDYLYKADGTWFMDPSDASFPLSEHTHGTWSIHGNRYTDEAVVQDAPSTYTIILLTNDNFIFSLAAPERPILFFERRSQTGGMPIMRDDPAP